MNSEFQKDGFFPDRIRGLYTEIVLTLGPAIPGTPFSPSIPGGPFIPCKWSDTESRPEKQLKLIQCICTGMS